MDSLQGTMKMPGLYPEILELCGSTVRILNDLRLAVQARVDLGYLVLSLIGENHGVEVRDEFRGRFDLLRQVMTHFADAAEGRKKFDQEYLRPLLVRVLQGDPLMKRRGDK